MIDWLSIITGAALFWVGICAGLVLSGLFSMNGEDR